MSWQLRPGIQDAPGPPSSPGPREGRLERSWRMTKAALDIVRGDRTLIRLALVQTLCAFAGGAAIFWLGGGLHGHGSSSRLALWSLILSLPLTFTSVFFGVALTAAANARLEGGSMTARQALGVAAGRLGQILMWSALSTVVGVVIRELVERLPFGGKIASWLAGVAWSLATMFVVPVLALEGCGAFECVRRSSGVFRQRWGEGVSGQLVIGAWTVVLTIPAAIAIAIGLALRRNGGSGGPIVIAIAIGVLFAVFALAAVVTQTFQLILYRYALGLAPPPQFSTADLQNPLRRKKGD